MSCSAPGCSNARRFKPEGVSFHTFPRSELLEKWLDALGKHSTDFTWSKGKLVCSKHFKEEDFIVKGGKKTLKITAVPCIERPGQISESISEPSTSKDVIQSQSTVSSGSSMVESSLEERQPRPLKRKLSKRMTTSSNKQLESSTTTTSSDSSAKRRRIAFVKTIHSYSISPRKLKAHNIKLTSRQKQFRKKLYSAQQKISTLKKQITNLKTVVDDLRQQNYISDYAMEHLENSYSSVPRMLMSRCLKNIHSGTTSHEAYPPILREFACILQFYSNKGYEYVRKEFALALPHQATIRKWCSNVDCSPGYIQPAFEAVKRKVSEASHNGKEVICSMMIDEIAIKKQIDFDGDKMWGYIDVGASCESGNQQPATEAFVVMVVAHQSHWKVPIAYFLIKSLTGREKANIVNECLIRLKEIGVVITSLTCDGPTANFTMMKALGCNLEDVHDMKPWFTHPSDENQEIFCILDVCHLLKLIRNMLASLEEFKDPEGCIVSWKFIKALYDLQEKETLTIVNKLKKSHLEWYKQKMKVTLAAQTLSNSVADALEFLNKELHLPEFEGCEATVNFIRRINNIFDILNSRTPWAKGYKAPLRAENEETWRPYLLETSTYLLYCCDVGGRPLWSTPKKTPIIGFVISSLSVCGIFDNFVKNGRLNYLLTYKCSQDHLELFFCMIRSRNGWNNNPSALQFMRTFRKLLLHSHISERGGNCRVLDTTSVLTVPSTKGRKDMQSFDISAYRKYGLQPEDDVLYDHDYDVVPNFCSLSGVSANIVTYMTGFVIKMLRRSLKCLRCLETCIARIVEDDSTYKLLFKKNRGGLYIPSKSVSDICATTEVEIRKMVVFNDNNLPEDTGFINVFVMALAQKYYGKIYQMFPELEEHFREIPIREEHHGYTLIKEIIRAYTKIRFYNLAKKYTTAIQGTKIRHELTKLVLFNHQ